MKDDPGLLWPHAIGSLLDPRNASDQLQRVRRGGQLLYLGAAASATCACRASLRTSPRGQTVLQRMGPAVGSIGGSLDESGRSHAGQEDTVALL